MKKIETGSLDNEEKVYGVNELVKIPRMTNLLLNLTLCTERI